MTRSSPLTDAEPAPVPGNRARARLGRLDFGKYCAGVEGRPVERNDGIPIGYSQLGWSEGFPPGLIPHCHPDKMGSSEGESDLPPDAPHGSVLRPVFVGGRDLSRVFYRVQTRAEDGDGREGRRYTMARYLVADDERVDPLTLLRAMDSEPMRGLTREEARSMIRPLNVDLAAFEPGPLADAFLREGVAYVLSGVPLGITEEMTEGAFFSCVAALWRALPPALRPYLSAGWCVGNSFSGRLTVTRTSQRASEAALFSPSLLTWSRPDVLVWDENLERVRTDFSDRWLNPGRSYTRHVFDGGDGSWPEGSLPPAEKPDELVGTLPPLRLSEFPDWQEKAIIHVFRFPGLKADNQFALDVLADWLRSGEGRNDPRLRLDARQFRFQAVQFDALDLIIKALGDTEHEGARYRGDRALWISLSGECPERFFMHVKGVGGAGSHRARFLASLARGRMAEALTNLLFAETHKEAGELPEFLVHELEVCLNESLRAEDVRELHTHASLLESPPRAYRDWVGRAALHLMGAMASDPDKFRKAYGLIIDLCESEEMANAARALRELIEGNRPPAEYLRGLSREHHEVFVRQFNREWDRKVGNVAERRERLLAWFQALGGGANHPLLRLMTGEPLSNEHVTILIREVETGEREVEGGYVPQSLVTKLAALVLRDWPRFSRSVRANPRLWSIVHACWPSLYARALVGGVGTDTPDPEVARAAAYLQPSYEDVDALLRERLMHENFRELASLFWMWAARLQPEMSRRPTAVDLCWYLNRGELPEQKPRQPDTEVDACVRVARLSGAAQQLTGYAQRLWSVASRGWQMMLLMRLFPTEPLNPGPQQLGEMLHHADWLREHLAKPGLNPYRSMAFELAVTPFHGIEYRQHPELYPPGFAKQSVVWAAFRGVPVAELPNGALRDALRAYTQSNPQTPTAEQGTNVLERQAQMCLTFLSAYDQSLSRPGEPSASQERAIMMVLYQFVFPLLCYGQRREIVEEMLDSLGSDLNFPDYMRKNQTRYRWQHPTVHHLVATLLRLVPNRSKMMVYLDEYYKSRRR